MLPGLIAKLRSGNYEAEDLDSAERLVRDHDFSGRLRRQQVADALIDGLERQRYPSRESSRAIEILVTAGGGERIVAALTRLAGANKAPVMRVDAAEALVQLGDNSGVELLTARHVPHER